MNAENGIIRTAEIQIDRGFVLTCWLGIEFANFHQGFGGYVLGGNPFDGTAKCADHAHQANYAADFIGGVLAVVDVEKFSSLVGKTVRVKREGQSDTIVAIGHVVKDRWYEPTARFNAIGNGGPK